MFTGKQAQPAERSEGSRITPGKILRYAQDGIAIQAQPVILNEVKDLRNTPDKIPRYAQDGIAILR